MKESNTMFLRLRNPPFVELRGTILFQFSDFDIVVDVPGCIYTAKYPLKLFSSQSQEDIPSHFTRSLIISKSSYSRLDTTNIKMHYSIILATLFTIASLAAATPTPRDIYYGVSVNLITSAGLDPNKVSEPAPVQINTLTPVNCGSGQGCSVSELILDPGVHVNVDINTVECRGYKDTAGVVPGSLSFNVSSPAEISTNLGTIGSILCYIIEVD